MKEKGYYHIEHDDAERLIQVRLKDVLAQQLAKQLAKQIVPKVLSSIFDIWMTVNQQVKLTQYRIGYED